MKLTCDCCGFIAEFKDGEEAFHAGWDAPPHFSGYVACNLCPAVSVIFPDKYPHNKAHKYWAEHGRPAEFGPLCVHDADFGNEEKYREAVDEGKKFVEELKTKIQ